MRDDESAHGPWEVLRSRVVFEHRFHPTVIEERVRVPDGPELDWVRWETGRDTWLGTDVVTALCVDDAGRVLVARQWNHGAGAAVDEFPGGGVEPGEVPEAAMVREVREETGLRPRRLDELGRFYLNHRRSPVASWLYLATDLVEDPLPSDEAERITVRWCTPAELDDEIAGGRHLNPYLLAAWSIARARGAV